MQRAARLPDGLNGVFLAAGGAWSAGQVYFATYEKCKQALVSSGVGANSSNSGVHPAAAGLSGSLATVVSDAVALPMDVVKQRLQLPGTPYKGVANCVSRVLREEGVAAFFRSYQTTLVGLAGTVRGKREFVWMGEDRAATSAMSFALVSKSLTFDFRIEGSACRMS